MDRAEGFKDRILQEDLERIVQSGIPIDEMRNSTVFITGATGLIGSLLVRTFAYYNRVADAGIRIIALARDPGKAEAVYGQLLQEPWLDLLTGDVTEKVEVKPKIDYIFHCAAITASKEMADRPVEVLMTSVLGTRNILELAARKTVKSFLYLSSMEMYGVFEGGISPVTETDLGYIDLLKVRSNYPESKRLCENLCVAYRNEYNVPVKIARLAQTFGAGVLPGDNRVFSQFAGSVIRGEDIVLHTLGNSEGNYCYTSDSIKGLLLILLKGNNGEAYNVSNEETHTTIIDMAHMVSERIAGGKITVRLELSEEKARIYAADTKMKLSSGKLRRLGWKPEVGLEEAYRRFIESMKDGSL